MNNPPIISIEGLTDQQAWLAQQLWLCESLDEIADLKDSVDEDMIHDLHLVMELIFTAHIDQYVETEEDCSDVHPILQRVQHESKFL